MPTMPSWRKALDFRAARRERGSIEDFVVITGFSGAGKSQAMACFEDAGYFCVDNLPPEMIGSLADLFATRAAKSSVPPWCPTCAAATTSRAS